LVEIRRRRGGARRLVNVTYSSPRRRRPSFTLRCVEETSNGWKGQWKDAPVVAVSLAVLALIVWAAFLLGG